MVGNRVSNIKANWPRLTWDAAGADECKGAGCEQRQDGET